MEENKNQNSIIQVDKGIELPTPKYNQNSGVPSRAFFRDFNDFLTFEVSIVVPYNDAADSNYYPTFYVATVPCFLLEAKMKHAVAGGSNAAVTVVKVPSGSAKSVGGSMLDSVFDLTATANIVQSKTRSVTLAGVQLVPGDSMALRPSGTLTSASDVCVTVLMGIAAKDLPTGANV